MSYKDKTFKTLDEQLQIFKNKGLIMNDYEKTKNILFRENYFFINGYRHLFLKSSSNRVFIDGTTFEEIYSLFTFDRRFRNIIFKNVLIIENNIKSIMSYRLSKKYGFKEKEYLNPKNFSQKKEDSKKVKDLTNKMQRQVRVNGQKHSATMHYMSKYGYIPLWIMVKVLSFGIIGELFGILKTEDKAVISNYYKMDMDVLENYLVILSNYRNLCAHEDILFEHKTQRIINNTKYHEYLKIPMMDSEYIYGKNDLFALIIILRQMLSNDEFRLMIYEVDYELNILKGKLQSISIEKVMDRMGMPINYKNILDIESGVY